MISVCDVSKSYGSILAVNGLSFEVPPGELFGLLGPNGAGKTTTVRMLTGTLVPDAGRVTLVGQTPDTPAARSCLGVCPQSLALYEELTARENLEFFASLYGLRGRQRAQRVDWAIELAQLDGRQRQRVGGYSGGMKRRLNLAAALVHDPQVLLLDEPTVGVDPQSRHHLLSEIEQLKVQGKTVIFTSHYIEEVERLCDRVAIVDHGELLALDTVDGLLRRFSPPAEVCAELASSLPSGVALPGEVRDGRWVFQSHAPFEAVAQATSAGVELRSLNVSRPNLESVFLQLTGRRLRD